MRDLIRLNVKKMEIFEDCLLKLSLKAKKLSKKPPTAQNYLTNPFLRRIRVVEPNNHLAIIHIGKILIENCCFCVAYVKVAARLGRKAGYDLTLLGILEA
jgi:hypothetical protein